MTEYASISDKIYLPNGIIWLTEHPTQNYCLPMEYGTLPLMQITAGSGGMIGKLS